MHLQLTPYVIPSFLGGIITSWLAIYTWRRRSIKGALPFSMLMGAVAIWSIAYVVEIAGTDLQTKLWAAKIKYIGTTTAPVFWLIFTLTFTNREKWLKRPLLFLLFCGPIVTLLLMFTTEQHGLVYQSVTLETTPTALSLHAEFGVWYWIHLFFSYACIVAGIIILLTSANLSTLYRWQTFTIILACLVPVLINLNHHLGIFLFPYTDDPTPFAFALSGLLFTIGIFRYRLFDIVPIARRTVWQDMHDAIFAIDHQERIVSVNPATLRLLNLPDTAVIGKTLSDLDNLHPTFSDKFRQAMSGNSELTFSDQIYELRVSDLHDHKHRFAGRLFVARDITARKQAEEALRQAKAEIETALQALEIEQQKSEALLLNVLPQSIAKRLKENNHTIADNFNEATILFADIVNFTPFSANQSAIELVKLLNNIFSAFDDLADKYNLEKIKTIGDAYMVVGGLPLPQPNHAEQVASMALEMMAIIKQFTIDGEQSLNMRIGINTGPVVAGVIGRKKFIYDLWGDAVNIASRMESHGIAGAIQVTPTTYHCLKDTFYFEERGVIQVKGKGELPTYLLQGRLDATAVA